MKVDYLYDTEIYPNLLLYVFKNTITKQYFSFHISPYRDDRHKFIHFLRNDVNSMIGFNVLRFDYPLLHHLLGLLSKNINMKGQQIVKSCFDKAQHLIRSQNVEIRDPLIKQVDLLRMHHFDNKAKMVGLKYLQFVMRVKNMQELPFPIHTILTEHQCGLVEEYCINDVDTTEVLFDKSTADIELRERLSIMYNMNIINWNEPKIGEQILIKIIMQRTGLTNMGKTYRSQIVIKDILFPYISFNSAEFRSIHQWFSERTISETKGVFSKISLDDLGAIALYCNQSKKMLVKGKLKTLNVVYRGFQYDFGTGGLHGSIQSGVYHSDDEWSIEDIDVQSYYPKLGIENKLFPEHLSEEFCNVYEEIFKTRTQYPKNSVENKGLKLALNGAYGKSNSEFSPLYDPKYTMSITINGQLLLCMLAEMLSCIPELIMLQANTDGITVKIRRKYVEDLKNICNLWEKITHLTLEYSRFKMLVIRDVNNYLAVYEDNAIKRKGAFEYKREMYKNHSMLIVPKALEAFFVQGISPEKFVAAHQDYFDFFKRTRIIGNSRLTGEFKGKSVLLSHITRYYVSNQGASLVKIMQPLKGKDEERRFAVEANQKCIVINKITDDGINLFWQQVNYEYYLTEIYKIIKAIEEHEELEDPDMD